MSTNKSKRRRGLKHLGYFVLISFAAVTLCVSQASAAVYDVKSYGARGDGKTDDGPSIQSAIQAAISAGKNNEVHIPEGIYLLNDGRMNVGAALQIRSANKLQITGDPRATLIVTSPDVSFFNILSSSDISLNSLTLDRDPIVYSQVNILSIDDLSDTVTVNIEQGYPALDTTFVEKSKWLLVFDNRSSGTWGDHDAACGWYKQSDPSVCWPPSILGVKKNKNGQWLIRLNTKPRLSYVGAIAAVWGGPYKGEAFLIKDTKNFLAQDITYFPGGDEGAFRLFRNSGTFTFRRFLTDVKPGTGQLVAGIGGAMVYNNHLQLIFDQVKILHVWDDDLNIGANFARVVGHNTPSDLDVDGSRADFRAGDMIAVWNWMTKNERYRAKIIKVSCASSAATTLCHIKLDHNVTIGRMGWSKIKSSGNDSDGIDRILDIDSSGKLSIRHSEFQSYHAHGIVDRAFDSTIVDSLFYDIAYPAIFIGPDFYWDEGGPINRALIQQNVFRNVGGSNILVENGNVSADRSPSKIEILKNQFLDSGRFNRGIQGTSIITIKGVSTGRITGNNFAPLSRVHTPSTSLPIDTGSGNINVQD